LLIEKPGLLDRLGSVSDKILAQEFNVTKQYICQLRQHYNIKPCRQYVKASNREELYKDILSMSAKYVAEKHGLSLSNTYQIRQEVLRQKGE
jgi:hypothetical protein